MIFLSSRLRELAFLNKGIRLTITDRRDVEENVNGNGNGHEEISYRSESFYSDEGLKEFVKFLDVTRESIIDQVIYIDTEKMKLLSRLLFSTIPLSRKMSTHM
jgi:DNA gyrase subunit B